MRLRLLKLELRNFKGIRHFVLEANGADCIVYGANETGKTTLVDAYQWLLFGRDSHNRADFGVKTLGEDGQPITGLDHEVEAVFDADGRRLTLRRVLSEKWAKRRGSATSVFTGHETTYYVDGVPVKEKDYQARVAAIAPEAVFRLLTDPYHFNRNLSWQERRRILLEVCGDVSDQEVISTNSSLQPLLSVLSERSLDDHRKVVQARMGKINAELREIPARIDEASRALPQITEDEQTLRAKLGEIEVLWSAKREALAQAAAEGPEAQAKLALREVEAELIRLRTKREAELSAKLRDLMDQQFEAEQGIKVTTEEIARSPEYRSQLESTVQRLETELTNLRQRWHLVNDRMLEYEPEPVCPTCGQPLPEEKLMEARKRALADFNLRKAQELEAITTAGKQRREELERTKEELARLEQRLTTLELQRDDFAERAKALKAEIEAVKVAPLEIDREIEAAEARKQELEAQLQAALLAPERQTMLENLRQEIAGLEEQARAIQAELSRWQLRKRGLARIDELKAQEKALAAEYERLQGELYLIEEFIRTKVRLLEDRINSKFRHARFKLFEQQVNGGLTETCVTLYKGVPYPDLNGAAKINIGLDIINTLAEHYGLYAPIFVDERESVTELWPLDTQVISLVVSPQDKTLRVEMCGKEDREEVRKEAIA